MINRLTAVPLSRAEKNRRALETAHLMPDLGRRAARGGAIAVGAQAVRMGLQLVAAAVMARLLAPEDFGLVAMAAAVTGFVGLFTDLGLSAATVQRREIEQETVSALFHMNVIVGVLLMFVAMSAAPLAAWGYGDERVFWLVVALALQIPVAAAGAQHGALLRRGMRWTAIQWTGIAAQVAGATVGILLAWRAGLGYWALVAQGWTAAFVGTLLVWSVCPWRPDRVRDWAGARSALSFGLNLTGFNLVNYFHRQFDNVLIGFWWGPTQLGYYSRAYALLLMPLMLINGPIGSAVVPALSRLQGEPERWRKMFLEALGAITLVSAGIAAVLIVAAEPLVAVVYGPGWSEAARIFSFLAVSMFAATPLNATGWIYVSLGRTNRMFLWSIMAVPVLIAAFIIGLPFGPAGLALAYSAAMWLTLVPGLAFAARQTPVQLSDMLRVIAPPTAAGIGSVVAGGFVDSRLPELIEPLLRLGITGIAAASAYGFSAVLILLCDKNFSGLRHRASRLLRMPSSGYRAEFT